MDILTLIFYSIYFMIPAYLANGSALVFGGGTRMDFGKYAHDGRRLIGDGCTWRGTIGAGFFGMIVGGLLGLLAQYGVCDYFFSIISSQITIVQGYVYQGLLLGFGALIGDAIGSFIKRRLNFERGKPVPLLDQLDFVVMALIFASMIITITWDMFIILMIVSVFLHLGANIFAYMIHLKDVWY